MRKVLVLALGVLALTAVPVLADEVKGTVTSVNPADRSVVLDDGTKLTVSEHQLTTLAPGAEVRAMYQTEGGKNVVTDIGVRGIGSEQRSTTNWGPVYGTSIDSIQSGD